MKNAILFFIGIICLCSNVKAQWTRANTINAWDRRFVPPQDEVDSTFTAIVFVDDLPSYNYAAPNGWTTSTNYGDGVLDSVDLLIDFPTPTTGIRYLSVAFTANNVVGYPEWGVLVNVITAPAAASQPYFVNSDTVVITFSYEALTTGITAVDSMRTTLISASSLDASTEAITTTTAITTDNLWHTYNVTLRVTHPIDNLQQVFVQLEPYCSEKNDVIYIANARASFSN